MTSQTPVPGVRIIFFMRAAKGDASLPEQFGIAPDDALRFAFMAGLDAERRRIRAASRNARFTYRGVDDAGQFVEIPLGTRSPYDHTPDGDMAGRAMPAAEIAKYRMASQTQMEIDFKSKFTLGAAQTAAPETSPALDDLVSLEHFRRYKDGAKARAIKAALEKQGSKGGMFPGMPDQSHVHAMLDQQAHELALEKMAHRARLYHVIAKHGHEMFGQDDTLKKDMQRAILADEYLREALLSKDSTQARRHQAQKMFGKRTVNLFLAANSRKRRPTAVMGLLQDYDLLANRLQYRSGIADLKRNAREQVLSLCRRHAGPQEGMLASMPGFAGALREAALHVHMLIVTDLFSAPELRLKYAL